MNLKNNHKWLTELLILVLGMLVGYPVLVAQGSDQPQGQPARAVRLSYVDGTVRLSQANRVLAEQAVVNTPLLEGMQLATADNGRAEIQFEDGSVARLAPYTTLTLSVLQGSGSAASAELLLEGGLAYFELQGSNLAGTIRVRFGDTVATTSGFSVLRVAMDNPPGQIAVFSGNAHLEGVRGEVAADLHGGENITLDASNPSRFSLAESIEPNSWDSWNSDRDQALTTEASQTTGTASELGQGQNPAWSDLDANGNWYNVPGEGYVWSPYDAENANFDPYGYGNWMWTPGYGYLWVSGYTWGYYPFQCGLWNFYPTFGWGWAPGMGGCRPWWNIGFYGGINIGYTPPRYHVIGRPVPPHQHLSGRPLPIIAVNHHQQVSDSPLPSRHDRSAPVVISGSTVVAIRTVPSRPIYNHSVPFSPSPRQPGNAGNPGGRRDAGGPGVQGTQPGNQRITPSPRGDTDRRGYVGGNAPGTAAPNPGLMRAPNPGTTMAPNPGTTTAPNPGTAPVPVPGPVRHYSQPAGSAPPPAVLPPAVPPPAVRNNPSTAPMPPAAPAAPVVRPVPPAAPPVRTVAPAAPAVRNNSNAAPAPSPRVFSNPSPRPAGGNPTSGGSHGNGSPRVGGKN